MDKNINFEEKINALEEMAQKMESGELSLEESLKSYEEAMNVIKECEAYINSAKLRIEKVGESDKS
jgi:exodeoxyribonuclease VII small subunit